MRKKYKDYFITIGLEIHVSLKTKEKLFSSTPNEFSSQGDFSLFDAATPGVLPTLGKEPVEMAIAFGLATKSEIRSESYFDRKHYMYPDLPLGYQITQQHKPILWGGEIDIMNENNEPKKVIIEHSHLECDAAKSLHDIYSQFTAIDLSRASAPLIEIVSTPCLHSPYEAKEYAKKVYALCVFMGICDGKIEEGSFRVDASISLNKLPDKLGTRVEIKNISSFTFLEAALNYEIERQAQALDNGVELIMETRLFNEQYMETKSMRKKETVDEYRYLPCPDIPALIIDDEMLDFVKSTYDIQFFDYLEKVSHLFSKFSIKYEDSLFGTYWKKSNEHLWKLILSNSTYQTERAIRMVSFWILESLDDSKQLLIEDFKTLYSSSLQAKEIKETISLWQKTDKSIKDCMPSLMDDSELEKLVSEILKDYSQQIQKYKDGDEKIANFLVGKVMAGTKGKASAQSIKETVLQLISN